MARRKTELDRSQKAESNVQLALIEHYKAAHVDGIRTALRTITECAYLDEAVQKLTDLIDD